MDECVLELLLEKYANDYKILNRSTIEAIIIRYAYLERILEKLLTMKLADSDRELPANTFYTKIDIAYKAGLISSRFRDDLHLVRIIRNKHVHYKWENKTQDRMDN